MLAHWIITEEINLVIISVLADLKDHKIFLPKTFSITVFELGEH